MKIERHYSLQVAYAIVLNIESLIADRPEASGEDTVSMTSFSNGREQGVCLTYYPCNSQVAICQQRNSDEITIYYGKPSEFDITTNLPKHWQHRQHFRYNEQQQAAEWIVNFLFTNKEEQP